MSQVNDTTVQQLVTSVQERLQQKAQRPLATYRLQFQARFTFADAIELIPYLHELGISHIYASPYLRARRGSVHGYDVCSHEELNPELGTVDDFERFVATLRQHGMGHVLDIVPNHMSATAENPWWFDVLENGQNSPYSRFFDIDWKPIKAELANRVLLPILGEQYGEALESGKLKIEYSDGSFRFQYYNSSFPIGPKTAIPMLEHLCEKLQNELGPESEDFVEFQSIVTALQHLPPQTATEPQLVSERQREKEVIKRRLRDLQQKCQAVARFIERNVAELNGQPGDPHSLDRLDQLVRAQVYRLCHWKAAADEINYRRFFDINELAAICMEQPEVFQRAHRLIMKFLVDGKVDGVRIDHVDGLYDPTQYLWRLQWTYLEQLGKACCEELNPRSEEGKSVWDEVRSEYMRAICKQFGLRMPAETVEATASAAATENSVNANHSSTRASEVSDTRSPRRLPLYVLIEKILGADEPLPAEWPVAGTTGYDFLSQLNGLFLEPRGYVGVEQVYSRFIGTTLNFANEVHRCKLLILRVSMSSELQMLAHQLNRISEQHRRTRDFTLNSLRHALREILSCFPVYRTYPVPTGVSDRDRRFTNLAVARAKRRNPAIDSALFDFVRSVLLFEHPEGLAENARRERETFAGRFQQVTSPVMAKGVEDTAFYVVCPLLSVNEVGSHPPHAVLSIDQFHKENIARRRSYPDAMLATSTHDTKRSEDVRARLNVLTELPLQWRKAINQWARMNRRHLSEVDGEPAPSRNDEYVFYQTLLGVWPLTEPSVEEQLQLVNRLQQFMEKATRESKVRTSWINPNHPYDAAIREFVAKTLERRKDNRFLREFRKFAEPMIDWGCWTAISQLTLKLLSPGVPDIYFGQERWNLSLVDPDNRRLVDFAESRKVFQALKRELEQAGRMAVCERLRKTPRDPASKLFVTWQALQVRNTFAELIQNGEYAPLVAEGARSEHVCAFAWRPKAEADTSGASKSRLVIVAVPRYIAKLDLERPQRELQPYFSSAEAWADTSIQLGDIRPGVLKNAFTGQVMQLSQARISAIDLFRDFPVAVLASD
jgi:(1->4)-alpha-D-glucan 1-alpha-D-glucosylmutase